MVRAPCRAERRIVELDRESKQAPPLSEVVISLTALYKKDRQKGGLDSREVVGGLEVDAAARIDQVEVVDALGDVSQLAEALAI